MQNFIGEDGTSGKAEANKNSYRTEQGFSGIFFSSDGMERSSEHWGEMALVTTTPGEITYRTAWKPEHWGSSILDFWDDLSRMEHWKTDRIRTPDKPMASLAVKERLLANETKTIRFLITWYFPNRRAWSTEVLENFYSSKYRRCLGCGIEINSSAQSSGKQNHRICEGLL